MTTEEFMLFNWDKERLIIPNEKYYLVLYVKDTKRSFTKYFENESMLINFLNKIKYVSNLLIIEDSRDIKFSYIK